MALQTTDDFEACFSSVQQTNLLEHIPNLHNSPVKTDSLPFAKFAKNPFKTQVHFLDSLNLRNSLYFAQQVNYSTRTINFSSTDSKSIVWNCNDTIYDIVPHWLRGLPASFTNLSSCINSNRLHFTHSAFNRANLSFSHFVATDLAQLLISNEILSKDVPIVTPWLTSWQKALINFFGVTRKFISLEANFAAKNLISVGFEDSFLIEDLWEFEGLTYCRFLAQNILQKKNTYMALSEQPILWLGRLHYERNRGLSPRLSNLRELISLIKEHSIVYIDPTTISLDNIANLLYNAKLVISESGSHFINYLLFVKPRVPIIQLSPHGTLGPTWSYYNVNNMQWYYPVKSHLFFYEGVNTPQKNRQYGSPWNVPSSYEPSGLQQLITDLLSA